MDIGELAPAYLQASSNEGQVRSGLHAKLASPFRAQAHNFTSGLFAFLNCRYEICCRRVLYADQLGYGRGS